MRDADVHREVLSVSPIGPIGLMFFLLLPLHAEEQRVVSLAPSVTEIVCAIGAQDVLVGRTSACDYPADLVTNIPTVGGFGKPSFELLVAAKPTLVLHGDSLDDNSRRRMDEMGIPRRYVPHGTLDDIPRAVTTIGELLHRESRAKPLADKLSRGMADLRKSAPAHGPLVFVEIWSDPLMTAGEKSFISELIRLAGGRNVGDDVAKDYYRVSSEWVVERNPDVILCSGMSEQSASRRMVMEHMGWGGIKAVKTGRVYDNLGKKVFTRPGPRVLEAVAELQALFSKAPEKP